MSYNISSITIQGDIHADANQVDAYLGSLVGPCGPWQPCPICTGQGAPDITKPESAYVHLENFLGSRGTRVIGIHWCGEFSGHLLEGLEGLLDFMWGDGVVVLCWERGDRYTGYTIKTGQPVKEGEVTFSVTPKEEP